MVCSILTDSGDQANFIKKKKKKKKKKKADSQGRKFLPKEKTCVSLFDPNWPCAVLN